MDFAGQIGKFRVNRPLTENERQLQLKQKDRLDIEPHYQLSVIEMNSTYLESVDKWYGDRGTITAVTLTILGMLLAMFFGMLHIALTRDPQSNLGENDMTTLAIVTAMIIPFLLAAVWGLRKDSFAFTHYPLRFDRKTRIVHVFQNNGTVLSIPWDKIFFTLAPVDHVYKFWNILGHVLDDDEDTVKASFALSVSSVGTPDGIAILRSHWEFVRRYMEEGPAAVTGQVQYCMPIATRRENLHIAFHRSLANNSGPAIFVPAQIFNLVFDLLVLPFRLIAMRTSKLPHWPTEIETASTIDDGDPYAIAGTERGDRISLHPAAADAAGVQFTGPPGSPLTTPTHGLPRHGDAQPTPRAREKKR